jgi:hypothetical protein
MSGRARQTQEAVGDWRISSRDLGEAMPWMEFVSNYATLECGLWRGLVPVFPHEWMFQLRIARMEVGTDFCFREHEAGQR